MSEYPDPQRRDGVIDSTPYWRLTQRFTWQLLAVWFVLTFGIIFFARELDRYTVFGWPLSFYLAAQGATLGYVVLVGGYAWRLRRLDRRFRGSSANVMAPDDIALTNRLNAPIDTPVSTPVSSSTKPNVTPDQSKHVE